LVGVTSHELIIAVLLMWTVTALFGVNLLIRGRAYLLWRLLRPSRTRRTPRARAVLVLLHIMFAASGLVLWLLYVLFDTDELVYLSGLLLTAVAVTGFTIVDRWRHVPGRHAIGRQPPRPAGSRFPVWSATAHVMAGTTTLVLLLLSLLAAHSE
jgi:manganese efflux pump family protein